MAGSPTALEATVTGVEYQGTHVLVTLRPVARPDDELLVMVPEATFDAQPWAPGDTAWMHWRAQDVHTLFA